MTNAEKLHWVSIIESKSGQEVLRWLIGQTRMDEPSFAIDDRTTTFNEGKRAVGLALRRKIEQADPMGWLKLMKEEVNVGELERNRSGATVLGRGRDPKKTYPLGNTDPIDPIDGPSPF